jgi:hypothetical protein
LHRHDTKAVATAISQGVDHVFVIRKEGHEKKDEHMYGFGTRDGQDIPEAFHNVIKKWYGTEKKHSPTTVFNVPSSEKDEAKIKKEEEESKAASKAIEEATVSTGKNLSSAETAAIVAASKSKNQDGNQGQV